MSVQSRGAAWLGWGVALAAFALHAPSIGFDFIHFDDMEYIVRNPMVAGGFTWAGVEAAWTTAHESLWLPLLWMSFMLDVELFGLEPWGFHLVNVVLFALNAGLLFGLLRRWTGRTGVALAATLLWVCHPARVESVAWVVERKDVLSGLFFLLGIGAYVEGRRGHLWHGVVVAWLCMALGGLAKPIVIVMPAVLMLLDVWPLKRTDWDRFWREGWRLAGEKWAFWALALGLAVLPVWFHHVDDRLLAIPLQHRLTMIPVHYLFYFQKLVWPSGLAVLLANPPFRWSAFIGGCGILAGVTWGLWRIRSRAPWALMGWLWFVGTLFPLTGLVWGGSERVAVRFEYLPQIGFWLAVALGADRVVQARGWSWRWGAAACALAVVFWGGATLRLLPHWRNSQAIFTRVLQLNPNSVHALDNLGQAYFVNGQWAEWQTFLENARRDRAGKSIVDIHYAWWLAAMIGDADASKEVLEGLTGLSAEQPGFWLWMEGRTQDGKLLGLWRDTAGVCLRHAGDLERMAAVRAAWEGRWDERTRINFLTEMLWASWKAGGEAEAEALIRDLSLDGGPGRARAEVLGQALSRWRQGARGYAFECFRDYARGMPEDGAALNNMAWLVATAKPDGLRHARMEEWPAIALAWAERALALSGGAMAGIWDTVAAARANAGDYAGAVAAAERALELAPGGGDVGLAAKVQRRLGEYQSGKPWRE